MNVVIKNIFISTVMMNKALYYTHLKDVTVTFGVRLHNWVISQAVHYSLRSIEAHPS